jgi:hypothetical protein
MNPFKKKCVDLLNLFKPHFNKVKIMAYEECADLDLYGDNYSFHINDFTEQGLYMLMVRKGKWVNGEWKTGEIYGVTFISSPLNFITDRKKHPIKFDENYLVQAITEPFK